MFAKVSRMECQYRYELVRFLSFLRFVCRQMCVRFWAWVQVYTLQIAFRSRPLHILSFSSADCVMESTVWLGYLTALTVTFLVGFFYV